MNDFVMDVTLFYDSLTAIAESKEYFITDIKVSKLKEYTTNSEFEYRYRLKNILGKIENLEDDVDELYELIGNTLAYYQLNSSAFNLCINELAITKASNISSEELSTSGTKYNQVMVNNYYNSLFSYYEELDKKGELTEELKAEYELAKSQYQGWIDNDMPVVNYDNGSNNKVSQIYDMYMSTVKQNQGILKTYENIEKNDSYEIKLKYLNFVKNMESFKIFQNGYMI